MEQAVSILNREVDAERLHILTKHNKELREESEVIKQQQEKEERDQHDLIAYFHKELQIRDDTIASLSQQLIENKAIYELKITATVNEYQHQIKTMEETFQTMDQDLQEKLQTSADELSKLEIFQTRKEALEIKAKVTDELLLVERAQHEESSRMLERKFFEEKSRMQKESEKQIEFIKLQSKEEAQNGLDAETRKVIADNRRMCEELRFQIQTTNELQLERDELENKNKEMKMELEIFQDKEKEYAKQGQRQSKEIKQLHLKIKALEQSLNQMNLEFTKEKYAVTIKNKRELEDHSMDVDGLKRLIKLKNKELKNITKLAQTIVDQRTDVEQFFLDSLAHIKGEIIKERMNDKKQAAVHFNRQMKEATKNNTTKFPKIRRHFDPPSPSPTMLPTSTSEHVDIKQLSWEDRERVLRLLFARINGTQATTQYHSQEDNCTENFSSIVGILPCPPEME